MAMKKNITVKHGDQPDIYERFFENFQEHDLVVCGFDARKIKGETFPEKVAKLLHRIRDTIGDLQTGNDSSFTIFFKETPIEWDYPGVEECIAVVFGSKEGTYDGSVLEKLCNQIRKWDSYVTAESAGDGDAMFIGYYCPEDATYYTADATVQDYLESLPDEAQFIPITLGSDSDTTYYIICDHEDNAVETPRGNHLITQYLKLAELVCWDLGDFGPDPFGPLSSFTLFCSYVDFGLTTDRKELIANTISGLNEDWDLIFKSPADPLFDAFWKRCFATCEKDVQTVLADLLKMSRRQLTVMQVFGAHIQSIAMGHALITKRVTPAQLGQGLCPFLAQHLIDNHPQASVMLNTGLNDPKRYYTPELRNEDYCLNTCLARKVEDYPLADLTNDCALAWLFLKFWSYGTFPDEHYRSADDFP